MTTHDPLIATVLSTPFGPLAVAATAEDGVVRASGFFPVDELTARLPERFARRGLISGDLPHVADAVAQWLDGSPEALTAVPAEQDGGEFFQSVWARMREIPAGEPASYAELAALAGRPRAVRAAGTACARNDLAPFVPCHRVVKSGGALGNYGYGLDVKAAMLEMEAAAIAPARAS